MLFIGISLYSRDKLETWHAEKGKLKLHDIILSPMPANPFCWMLITVDQGGKNYRLSKGIYAPFGNIVSAASCPTFWLKEGTAELSSIDSDLPKSLLWAGQYSASIEALNALRQKNCRVSAFLHYARAPFFMEAAGHFIVGDLRYDMNRGLDFAEMHVSKIPIHCPALVPDWKEPRAALFSP